MVDFEVPKRYGLRQTIGDTLGVGGISRALRTIPVLLDVCRDMEELCPDALLLQYVNPMAMLCWAVAERHPDPHRRALPLRAAHRRASWPPTSASPRRRSTPTWPASTTSRSSCGWSGAARTSTRRCASCPPPGHQPRALRGAAPLRRVRDGVLRALRGVRAVVHQGGSARADRALQHPARRVRRGACEAARRSWEVPVDAGRSHEYGADIIRAVETGEPFRFNGNVANGDAVRAARRQPAARVLRRGPVRRRPRRHHAASPSAPCRRTSPR